MAVFKCKMCGGTIEFEENATVGTCEYCGTKQTLPKLNDDKKANLYDRANHFRRNNEFDKAMGIYEQILNEDMTDAEVYWSLVLCRYGIEYVEDPSSHKRVPTVNRAQFTSIFMDDDYKAAIRYADSSQKDIYEKEAKAIDDIQKGILELSGKEEPFDVFICYKETDDQGRRTRDSVLANDLYHQLTQEGFKVFFSRITLEDKLGVAYEPYIFAALNSAKVMVVLGTKPEYFNAVWVKNEWSRYLALLKGGAQKVLIPAYRDMDPYDLPEEFSHLQAQDMSKLGFMQDLVRGIRKIVWNGASQKNSKEIVVNNGNVESLLKRAFLFLEDEEWDSADEYCEKVLDLEPENARAYLGKLMASLQVRVESELENSEISFDSNEYYQKVMRFGDEKLRNTLKNYANIVGKKYDNPENKETYERASRLMKKGSSDDLLKAAEMFVSIKGYKDANQLSRDCREKALYLNRKAIYDDACKALVPTVESISFIEIRIEKFKSIAGFMDSDKKVEECRQRIAELKKREEDRNRKKVISIASGSAVLIVIILIVGLLFFNPFNGGSSNSNDSSTSSVSNDSSSISDVDEKYKWIENIIQNGPSEYYTSDTDSYITISNLHKVGDDVKVDVYDSGRGQDETATVVEYNDDFALFYSYSQKSIVNKIWLTFYRENGRYTSLVRDQDSDGYKSSESYFGYE